MSFFKCFKIKSVFLATVFLMILAQAVGAKENDSYPIEAVKFYPHKNITLNPTSSYVIGAVTDLLLTNPQSKMLNLTSSAPKSSSEYVLDIDYGVGCGEMRPQKNCRMMFLWRIMRADGAPVSGWRADYPVTVSDHQARNRFYNFVPPRAILKRAAKDFNDALTSMIAENSGARAYQTAKISNRNKTYLQPKIATSQRKVFVSKAIFVMPDEVQDKRASCSLSTTRTILQQNKIAVTTNKKAAAYVLKTKTTLQDAGGGFMGIKIERKLFNVKTGKGILIPQETALPTHHFNKHGMNCKSAIYTALPQIKGFLK